MRVRRGDLRDVYVEAGRSIVMTGETVVVLSELATAILEAVPEHEVAEVEQLTATIVGEFGEPEPPATAHDLTVDNVHQLIAHGILRREDESDTHAAASTPAAVGALRSALRHVRSEDTTPWRLEPGVTADEFLAAAHQHHVVSFLARHHERLLLPPGAAAALIATSIHRAAGVEILAVELATALECLEGVGVRALVVKGLALAVQAHGDVNARGAGDLDLLVAPADVERAHAALVAAGWSADPDAPQPGPAWAWRHLLRTGYEVSLLSSRSSIDLHWHLGPARATFPEFDVLWSRRSLVRVGDRDVATLGAYDALAHSAGHAAKDEWQWLRSLVDVHLLASLPETWRAADRPLRGDQLITIGLAARMLGVAPGAPEVVMESVLLTPRVWNHVLARQVATASSHVANPIPGAHLRKSIRTLRRTAGGPRDALRQLGLTLMPPWLSVAEPSAHTVVAVPRVLARRAGEVAEKLRDRARTDRPPAAPTRS